MRIVALALLVGSAGAGLLPRTNRPVHDPIVKFSVVDEHLKIPDRYVVSLKDGAKLSQHWKTIKKVLSKEGKDFSYMEDINAYVVTLKDADIIRKSVRKDESVEIVEST